MINYQFCPQCRNKLDLSGEYPFCSNCNETFYRNSKPTAGILPIKDGKVLLAKRGREPLLGHWDIVGGFLNAGEHPEVGALREAFEETNCQMKITKLLGMYIDKYDNQSYDTLNIFYLGEIISGDLKPQDDIAELHWVDLKDLDKITGGFKNVQMALSDLKNLYP